MVILIPLTFTPLGPTLLGEHTQILYLLESNHPPLELQLCRRPSTQGVDSPVSSPMISLIAPLDKQTSERLAVFFKVPYDLNIRKNEYAVGLLDVVRECDKNLYKHMATNTDLTVVRGQAKGPSLTFTGKDVTIRATMSENHAPVIKVDLMMTKELCF